MRMVTNGLIAVVFSTLILCISIESVNSAQEFGRSSLTVFTKSGKRTFDVEIASSGPQRAQGLQGRKTLPAGTGMLFDFQNDQIVTMWMKNTYISLDMLFITSSGIVHKIVQGTTPHSLAHITSGEPVRGVLEVRSGTTKMLGIRIGDQIKHKVFDAN